MTSRFLMLATLFLGILLPNQAQDLSSILFGSDYQEDYMGQYNYNGKRKNGFGIERFKNGDVYIGDFSEGKIAGRGMLISQKSGISNVERAMVYVGKWYNGKKEGNGVCYDSSGNAVFNGKFAKDKPDLSSAKEENKRFVMHNDGETLYLGETLDGKKTGFGLTVLEDGKIVFGMMKDDVRQGIGMVFTTPEVWEVGRWSEGQFTAFNNSQVANANTAAFAASLKENRRELRSELFSIFSGLAETGVALASDIKNNRSGGSAGGSTASSDGEVEPGKSLQYYQTRYDQLANRAKNTFEDRVRHKVTAKTSGDGRVASSDAKLLRQYQRSMRSTREIARKSGYILKKSKYEDVAF